MTENLKLYANTLNATAEVLTWLDTAAAKALKKQLITESELEHIVDYLTSSAAPRRFLKMSVVDAKLNSAKWSKTNQKKGKGLTDSPLDTKIVHDFLDGTTIVKLLSKKALEREGFLMSHCVGGYNPDNNEQSIYSYRDSANMPHATFELQKNGDKIVQIKGKGNGPIHPKYIHPILAFLASVKVNIRPNDMVNLGYYHVDMEHMDFLKKIGLSKQITVISGEAYAHG